jgi:hypothetical protein
MKTRWRLLLLAPGLALALIVLLAVGVHGAAAGSPTPDEGAFGVCPTQTTPLPVPFTLTVALQRPNSPPPSPAWAVPVTFTLYPPGDATTICHQWELTLDQSGRWKGFLDLFTGVYDARIRNLHTLRNVKRNVAIGGPATIAMGTLYEGDANADNAVNILDFGRLRNSYFLDEGMPGFDPAADFDENNTINILDFGLLRADYFMEGDIEVTALASAAAAPTTAPVTITVIPLARDLGMGEVTGFAIWTDATAQPLLGLDVELYYRLRGVAVTDAAGNPATSVLPGATFNVVLQNRVDTKAGRILFSAANFDAPVSGLVEVATFYLQGLAPGPAGVRFGSRTIGMDFAGRQLSLTLDRPAITVGGVSNYRQYYPLGLK